MSDLLELAERVANGEATNSEVDALLRVGVFNTPMYARNNFPAWRAKSPEQVEVVHSDGTGGVWWSCDKFLTSLDAAKRLHDLVLPGEDYSLGVSDGEFSASIVTEYCDFPATGDTLAAAWVAAILKAKAASSDNEKGNNDE